MPKLEKYNLQRLLEVRTRTREQAIQSLGECRLKLAAAETELAARNQAVKNCRQTQRQAHTAMAKKMRGAVKNSEILYHRQYLIDLREQEIELLAAVEQQKSIVERAEAEVETALLAVKEATKEMQVIEKHKENWQREKKVEATRKEQKSNDEIGAILHERSRNE